MEYNRLPKDLRDLLEKDPSLTEFKFHLITWLNSDQDGEYLSFDVRSIESGNIESFLIERIDSEILVFEHWCSKTNNRINRGIIDRRFLDALLEDYDILDYGEND